MIDITIANSDLEVAEQFLKGLGKTAERGITRAANRAAAGVRTDSVKTVRKEYTVKATTVRKSFKIKKAGNNVLEAAAVSSGSRLPLIDFGARPSKPNGKRTPVSVQVKKQRKVVKNAFVAQMTSGHVGVFERTGEFGRGNVKNKRGRHSLERIKHISTLSVPSMVSQEQVEEEIEENARKRFSKTLHDEISYAIFMMSSLGPKYRRKKSRIAF
jgi:hypothetical protein